MKVALDTNVIISALNFPGNERLVLELALRGRFEFFLSIFILGEVAGVLTRKFGWDEERTARVVWTLENAATVIEPPRLEGVIEGGHADNRVLECAVAVRADYLVTGDRRHLLPLGEHRGTIIVNAPRFLSLLTEVPVDDRRAAPIADRK
ncbi:MAG: putative toxin-antitoxin system toxin component, PIN family [Chloroflexota bacterium]|nr:putative toxin-antitoxin system toxin component, PIN family [Chloroflexota bacterium]